MSDFPLLVIYNDEIRLFQSDCPFYKQCKNMKFENIQKKMYSKNCIQRFNCTGTNECRTSLYHKDYVNYHEILKLIKNKNEALLRMKSDNLTMRDVSAAIMQNNILYVKRRKTMKKRHLLEELKWFFVFMFKGEYWDPLYKQDRTWDTELNDLLDNYDFIEIKEHTAKLGNYEIWISNHPFASFSNYSSSHDSKILPLRRTRLRAWKKLRETKLNRGI
jgi:hypothetical protein